jgi:hypothetical protein
MEGAIPGRACANAGDIKEGIDSPESIQACSHGIPHCKLVTDIRGSETRFTKRCRQSFAFVWLDADNKHWIFSCPQARRSGRDPR